MAHRRQLRLAAALVACAVVVAAAACDGDADDDDGGGGGDSGPVTLTMWTRSVTAEQSQALVDAYNQTHDNQIELTVVPFEQYLQNVGAAARGDDLPDLLAANVIDGPNYASQGLWQDITDRIAGLDYADQLAPSHIQAASWEGVRYAVPHVLDVSALYYNEVLLERAGLDPADPPATLAELADAAARLADGGEGGLYLPGNCAGCLVFTVFPSVWASGGTVMNEDGTAATLDSPEALGVFGAYHDMFTAGSMLPESRNEAGPTQNEAFAAGGVGFALLGSKALGTIEESDDLRMGVAPIPGVSGGVSTFVGGDVIGISSSASDAAAEAAWEFLAWSTSEQVQLDTYAQDLFIPVRTDLADNRYAAGDPRLLLFNELVAQGQTPYSARFFQTFNDPNGPWLGMIREAVFGGGPDAAAPMNADVTASLAG
jgi:multiple sugar transport system substrate-binding protein